MKKIKSNNLVYYSSNKYDYNFIEKIKKIFVDKNYANKSKYKDDPGRSTAKRTIHKVMIGGKSYFLKKFIYTNKRQCLRLNLGLMEDKAMRYYKNSKKLNSLGIDNVQGEAVFVYSTGLFNYECILVTKDYCEGTNGITYKEYLKGGIVKSIYRKKIIKDLFYMLDNNFFYNDFHFENILLVNEKIYYLDLDAGYQKTKKLKKNREKTIQLYKENLKRECIDGVISKNEYDLFIKEIKIIENKS
ncbi:hypothetical protein [Psychrilyobacter sp.]|uniref:hypothetical protein n=1 Tax=Psychrilyobacter sp. TaxID=2586924 RepID=UPI0030164EEF